ncbi:MAG: ribbon-helix-helix protein, CopG family [Microthrixaceae bacterium]|nr:ribbon-helix-helix protein, CopG family [Microthrixaceae bacterium]
MPDVLIRDVPDDVLGLLDHKARRLGLSRTEYLRRMLVRDSAVGGEEAALEHWRSFAQRHVDLDDPEVQRQAWT